MNSLDMSERVTHSMRGILTIMVLICHIRGRMPELNNTLIGSVLTVFGYLAVSVFFFLSGYGLMESSRKKTNYIEEFPYRRILAFYVMMLFYMLVYLGRRLVLGIPVTYTTVMIGLFAPGNIISNGWYLNTQLLLYILFYIGLRTKRIKTVVAIGLLIYISVCIIGNQTSTIYESCIPFVLGIHCSEKKQDLSQILTEHSWTVIIGLSSLFMVTLYLGNTDVLPSILKVVSKMVSSCIFALLAVALGIWMRPMGLLGWIGKHSLSIYVWQGIWLDMRALLKYGSMFYAIAVVVLTLFTAYVMEPITMRIYYNFSRPKQQRVLK